MTVRFAVRCLVGASLILSTQVAKAQVNGQSTLPASAVTAFQANPGQLLSQFPNGGPDMITQIVGLLGADKAALPTIITLAKTANEDQRKAMAGALAQVAKAFASGDPTFAGQIQLAVAASGLPEFAKAYAEAAGDTGTAAAGGGGGGGGGGATSSGPPTGGSNSGGGVAGSTFAASRASGLTSGSLGGVSSSQASPF